MLTLLTLCISGKVDYDGKISIAPANGLYFTTIYNFEERIWNYREIKLKPFLELLSKIRHWKELKLFFLGEIKSEFQHQSAIRELSTMRCGLLALTLVDLEGNRSAVLWLKLIPAQLSVKSHAIKDAKLFLFVLILAWQVSKQPMNLLTEEV